MKIVIIGGGTAGTTCAMDIRKQDKKSEIVLIEKSSHTLYSPCSLPYVIEGKIGSFDDVVIFREKFYEQQNINLKLNTECISIDNNKVITDKGEEEFDKLIIATGSGPVKIGNENGFKTMDDAKQFSRIKNKATIIGGGFIGVEVANALNEKGVKVRLFEEQDNILSSYFSKDICKQVKEYLEMKGIEVNTGTRYEGKDENVISCCGCKPDIDFVKDSIKVNENGIVVDEMMKTSMENVYACGDCIDSKWKLAIPAAKQAKVAASSVLGLESKYEEKAVPFCTKIGNMECGSVGDISEDLIQATFKGKSKAEYMPDCEDVTVRLYCDRDGRIKGSETVGIGCAERLNTVALLIDMKADLDVLLNFNNAYNPDCASFFSPIKTCAEICKKKIGR